MTDLNLVPTGDLLNALVSRFDHASFVGVKELGGGRSEYTRRNNGDLRMCLGLQTHLTAFTLKDLDSKISPTNGHI